jgi:hypothetical protein
MGDAAWSLEVGLSQAQVIQYLDDRKARGFTTVLFSAMEHQFCVCPTSNYNDCSGYPANYYGEVPFTNGMNDWSVRNEAYWQNVDYIISQAKARDMLVILAPAYLGYTCGYQGWCANMQAQTDAAMANYGTWIGNRYKNYGNIIWLNAVDANAKNYPNALSRVNAIANAIQATSSTYLQTAQSSRTRSALDDYNQPWLALNTTYTGTDPASLIKNDYQRSGALPFIHIEGYYENEIGRASCRERV